MAAKRRLIPSIDAAALVCMEFPDLAQYATEKHVKSAKCLEAAGLRFLVDFTLADAIYAVWDLIPKDARPN